MHVRWVKLHSLYSEFVGSLFHNFKEKLRWGVPFNRIMDLAYTGWQAKSYTKGSGPKYVDSLDVIKNYC